MAATTAAVPRATTGPDPVEVIVARRAVAMDPDAALAGARHFLGDASAACSLPMLHTHAYAAWVTKRSRWVLCAARVGLVEQLVAGRTVDWSAIVAAAESSIARQMVAAFGFDPSAASDVPRALASFIEKDLVELETLRGDSILGDARGLFAPLARRVPDRLAVIETRLSRRQDVLAAADAEFTRRLGAFLKTNRSAIERGVQESVLLSGKYPLPAPIAGAQRELQGALDQLDQLGAAAGSTVEPGPLTAGLQARAEELRTSIVTLRAAHAQAIGGLARATVDAATGLDGWVRLAATIRAGGASFPVGLAEGVAAVGVESLLAGDVLVWRATIESHACRDSPGPEWGC
jgi:hypothetical protein